MSRLACCFPLALLGVGMMIAGALGASLTALWAFPLGLTVALEVHMLHRHHD